MCVQRFRLDWHGYADIRASPTQWQEYILPLENDTSLISRRMFADLLDMHRR